MQCGDQKTIVKKVTLKSHKKFRSFLSGKLNKLYCNIRKHYILFLYFGMRKIKLKSLSTKQRAALLSICSNFFLIVLKFIVGILTGSISILSEAAHSFSDLIASFVAFISVRISSTPADDDHHYGHGKFEDLSGLIQGALILLTGSYIVYEATEKIYAGSFEEIKTTAGIIVMIISCIINFLVSCHLFKEFFNVILKFKTCYPNNNNTFYDIYYNFYISCYKAPSELLQLSFLNLFQAFFLFYYKFHVLALLLDLQEPK